ncbi:hypothetical protein QQF64_006682 [Cirrhinus molitorella]|uniref:Reverse transcriptase RNase H-like domain-containing protein n=1 Tax=Cirrhinus molitorella TaxID=172907 RepID=A0ABR3MC08_9TELE
MECSDISICLAKHQVCVGSDTYEYGATRTYGDRHAIWRAHVLRATSSHTLWPGDFVELELPAVHAKVYEELAVEPHEDCEHWFAPSLFVGISGKIRIPNLTDAPQGIRKHDHVCHVRMTYIPESLTEKAQMEAPQAVARKPCIPSTTLFSDLISLDHNGIMTADIRDTFREVHREFDEVFSPQFRGYNGAAGPFQVRVNMGPVQPPQWRYFIATDLTKAFYQIPLSKSSMKYCGVIMPFKGVRVYARCAMGMSGSETALEELTCHVLGDLLQQGQWPSPNQYFGMGLDSGYYSCQFTPHRSLPPPTTWSLVGSRAGHDNVCYKGGKLLVAGHFSAKLHKNQIDWLPYEIEALAIAAALKHFSPYIIQSSQKACMLTDSKPCIQAFEKLYYASRHAAQCDSLACQVCSFVRESMVSVVCCTDIANILWGAQKVPFANRATWLSIQAECPDLHRAHQLRLVVGRYFYALDLDLAIQLTSKGCHQCAALAKSPVFAVEQSSCDPPETVGSTFAADVLKREHQLILVVRECVTSFTAALLIDDEWKETLREAVARLNSRIRSRGMSACEMLLQRDQFSLEHLPVHDRELTALQHAQRLANHSHSVKAKAPLSRGHCDGSAASESEEECEASSNAPPSDPDIPMAIATPASPPGSDGSGSSEGRTVSPSGSVEVPCHQLFQCRLLGDQAVSVGFPTN